MASVARSILTPSKDRLENCLPSPTQLPTVPLASDLGLWFDIKMWFKESVGLLDLL